MKRLEEKVKDIVEVRASANLNDFLADPAKTLAGYHFTDITADLMAKWIGRITDVQKGRGAASALAGFRGVGKSHFMATLGAIVALPELRSGISDTHVMSIAHRLSRRHGSVAYVRRGSSDSLLSELKNAIANTVGKRSGELSDSLNELMLLAVDKSGETPFVLLIDTAFGRETRVERDDGALLSEIAQAAILHGIFVGIALDDDIAGADGLNSSIASNFTIDYLDQEHLYKVVNAHVFAKHEQKRPVLHEIYESYRAALPGFRWSEHRFSSLYPLHPAILEIAPFVRLYLHDFALLGFAAEAGEKILGRPANSLIGLDEVFDSIEMRLRGAGDLREAFAAYDSIDRDVVAKAPVMKRHEVKLILKGLFLVSFSGEGVTATELSAAMLIFDEADPAAGVANVETVLHAFSDAMPEMVRKSENPDREAKFSFKLGGGDNLNSALAKAIEDVPSEVVESVLIRQTAEKFPDFDMPDDGSTIWANCHVVWRGGIRRGEISWLRGEDQLQETSDDSGAWKVFIHPASQSSDAISEKPQWPVFEWKLGEMTGDDIDTIRRFHVLQTDADLREKYRESIPTVLHVHSIAVEKIWQRIFLEESILVSGENESRFTEAAISSHNLAQMFTTVLADHFEQQFPSHPSFPDMLGPKEVSLLTQHLFSGSGTNSPEIQKLASNFALPLGLVNEIDSVYVPIPANELAELMIVKEVLAGSESDDKTEIFPLDELSMRMHRAPYGLTRESQHLVLTALVAQRQFEFVTASGNRINHRSLDLQIIWDDIEGIAPPSGEAYTGDRLLSWATLLTRDTSLKALRSSEARLKLIDVLSDWHEGWHRAGLVEQFDMLPDEKLNSKLWRTASNVKKTFSVIAESVDGLLLDNVTIDECLQTIADVFADSEDEFESKERDLSILREFIEGATERDKINKYIALCEPTIDPETENLRYSLMDSLVTGYFDRREATEEKFRERWIAFKASYSDLYAERHDALMTSGISRSKLDELFGTDQWSMFSDLSSIPWFGRQDMEMAMAMIRKIRHSECAANVREILEAQPFCSCSFSMENGKETESLISDLNAVVTNGMDFFRQRVLTYREEISTALNKINIRDHDGDTLINLPSFLEVNRDFPRLSAMEIQLLKAATRKIVNSDPSFIDRRRPTFESFGAFHADDIRELEDQLDSLQDLSKLNG